jgi:sulfoxide reductase heme-binding subunit YedZ
MTLWFLARALGMVALLGFTASVCLGALASSTGRGTGAHEKRAVRQLAHRSIALVALGALALHVGLLVLDTHVALSLMSVVVPFTSGFAPFAVGLGTLAVWAFVATALSGLSRGRLAGSRVSPRAWRTVHAAAYVGWVLSMGHGVLAGTDTGRAWTTVVYVGCALAVGTAVALRVLARPRRTTTLTDSVPAHRVLVRGGS